MLRKHTKEFLGWLKSFFFVLKYLFRVGILATTSKVVPSGGHKKLVYSKVVVRLASRHSWSHAMLWEGLKYICRQLYVRENTMPNGLKNVQLLPHERQLLSVCILYSVGKYSPKVSEVLYHIFWKCFVRVK